VRRGIRCKLQGGRYRGAATKVLQNSAAAGGCSHRLGHDFLLVRRVPVKTSNGRCNHCTGALCTRHDRETRTQL
jgi:hypothetical protein